MENATTYITLLLQDNEQLKNILGAYLNTMLLIEAKAPRLKDEQQEVYTRRLAGLIDSNEKNTLIALANNFRSYALRCVSSINSIQQTPTWEEKKIDLIKEKFGVIETQLLPPYSDLKIFSQEVNDLVVKNINLNLFLQSQEKTSDLGKLMTGANTYGQQ